MRGVEGKNFLVSGGLEFNLEANDNLDMIITASNEGLVELEKNYKAAMINPQAIHIEAIESTRGFLAEHTQVITPNSVLNEGYKWALIGANRFYVDTPGLGQSLVAGYSTINFEFSLKCIYDQSTAMTFPFFGKLSSKYPF